VLVTAVAAEALTGAASWVHSLRQSYGGGAPSAGGSQHGERHGDLLYAAGDHL